MGKCLKCELPDLIVSDTYFKYFFCTFLVMCRALAYIPCAVLALPATMLTVLIGFLAHLYFIPYYLFELLFEFVAGKKASDPIF